MGTLTVHYGGGGGPGWWRLNPGFWARREKPGSGKPMDERGRWIREALGILCGQRPSAWGLGAAEEASARRMKGLRGWFSGRGGESSEPRKQED